MKSTLLILMLFGCSTSGAVALSKEAKAAIDEAMTSYEAIRASLAADQAAGVKTKASALAAAANKGGTLASITLKPHLEAMAKAARGLAELPSDDVEALRLQFGELSRPTVALLATEPTLTSGRFVYECGMAAGYGKWVQITKPINNPYQGSRMLECGTSTEWKE